MRINTDKKVIFLHNPKCGGNYIINLISKYYNFKERIDFYKKHINYKDFFENNEVINLNHSCDAHTIKKMGKYRYYYSHQDMKSNLMDEYFIFTFVRNPYSKIVSAYFYLKNRLIQEYKINNKYYIRNTPENIDYFKDFNTFIKNYKNICTISYFHSFITQFDQLINFSNKINISYIGKQESLDIDFLKVLNILKYNFNHNEELFEEIKLNSSEKLDIYNYYDEESFRFVNEYFKIDFETFGYKMYNSLNDFKDNFNKDKDKDKNNNRIINIFKLYYYNILIEEIFSEYLIIIKNIHFSFEMNCDENEKKLLNLYYKKVIDNYKINNLLKKIKNYIYILYKKYNCDLLFNNTKFRICEICNYKTYNELSYYCHNKTCK